MTILTQKELKKRRRKIEKVIMKQIDEIIQEVSNNTVLFSFKEKNCIFVTANSYFNFCDEYSFVELLWKEESGLTSTSNLVTYLRGVEERFSTPPTQVAETLIMPINMATILTDKSLLGLTYKTLDKERLKEMVNVHRDTIITWTRQNIQALEDIVYG